MPSTRQFRITLPEELADLVEQKVASGEYATPDDVFHAALHSLTLQKQGGNAVDDPTLDAWLKAEVLPAYDALQADPSRGLTPEAVKSRLAAARQTGAPHRP